MFYIKLITQDEITPHIEEVFTTVLKDIIGAVGHARPILQNTVDGNTLTVVTPTPLNEEQGDVVVENFKQLFPGTFYVEMPGAQPELPTGHSTEFERGSAINPYGDAPEFEKPPVTPEEARYMLGSLAQWQHQRWMDKRRSAGWAYGPEFNTSIKSHPLMVPWEQLPTEDQELDPEIVLKVLQLIRELGYTITR